MDGRGTGGGTLLRVERVLSAGAGPDAVAALRVAGDRLGAIRLPPGQLPGWSSLCAIEYRDAIRRLAVELVVARAALEAAIRAAEAP